MNLFLQSKNVQLPTSCPGCGTALQRADKNLPGFYVVPSKLLEEETEGEDVDEEEYMKLMMKEGKKEKKKKKTPEDWSQLSPDELARRIMAENSSVHEGGGEEESEDDFDFEDVTFVKDDEIEDEDEDGKEAIDAFESLFFEKDDGKEIDEDYELEMAALKKMNRLKRKPPAIVCARCFSLRNTGRPKNVNAEILLPSFDFKRSVGTQMERYPNNSKKGVVLVVVDLVDFDGSFPVDAVDALEPHAERGAIEIVLVANKVDLMPAQATRARLTQFVRRRAKAFGMQSASEVLLASATAGMGIRVLSDELEDILRNRGGHKKKDVYVVGAQNAGKSSLINRLSSRYDGPTDKTGGPLASHVPGTTIGVLKLEGILPNETDVYDTPGLLQPHQLSARMTADEAKIILPKKRMIPRTYRIQIGGTIHIGGVSRIDLLDAPQRTIYVTVWCSNDVPLHYTTNGAKNGDEIYAKHAGTKLTPPLGGEEGALRLGRWGSRKVSVYGDSWSESTRDISIAGVGWVAIACVGNADFKVWTHEGVQLETREALVPDISKSMMKPGFSFENVGGTSSNRRPDKRAGRERGGSGGGGFGYRYGSRCRTDNRGSSVGYKVGGGGGDGDGIFGTCQSRTCRRREGGGRIFGMCQSRRICRRGGKRAGLNRYCRIVDGGHGGKGNACGGHDGCWYGIKEMFLRNCWWQVGPMEKRENETLLRCCDCGVATAKPYVP